jgi:putative hydrolase
LHDELGIDTLEGLGAAARAGRLHALPGIGARREAALLAALTGTLQRQRRLRPPEAGAEPPVQALLSVDADYRQQALAGRLPLIAPKRFNPEGKAWLPVLHTRRGDWSFTAMYSNTARAHELGRTHDWVVIYAEGPGTGELPYTVVTAAQGAGGGERVVRGRESECAALHRAPG